MQNTAQQNYPGLVAFYDTRQGNKVGLFYNAPEHTRGLKITKPCLSELSNPINTMDLNRIH